MAPLLDDKDKELRHKANSVLTAMWAATWPREHIQYVAVVANYGSEVVSWLRLRVESGAPQELVCRPAHARVEARCTATAAM